MKVRVSLTRMMAVSVALSAWSIGSTYAQESPTPAPQAEAPPPAPPTDDAPPPVPAQEIEVLTRGAVHEAFATPVVFDPKPGERLRQAPPPPIDEDPPDQKPVGDNVTWISGYWDWDDETNRFVWISGIWRALPADMEWVPGYWHDDGHGTYQWVSGFWKKDDDDDVRYLPPPPPTQEAGPVGQPINDNQTWVPGVWVWRDEQYVWRPGYWLDCHDNWMWVPSHYVWTPQGCVYVRGYWDYSLNRRGVMFAPICSHRPGYVIRRYSPTVVIDSGSFTSFLFVNSNRCHYHYGDYYGATYRTSGYMPWFSFHSTRRGYDPLYAHSHWQHRHDRDWDRQQRADFDHRNEHEQARPPRRFDVSSNSAIAIGGAAVGGAALATTINHFVNRDNEKQRFQQLQPTQVEAIRSQTRDLQAMQRERSKVEKSVGALPAVSTTQPDPNAQREIRSFKIPKSPVSAKKVEEKSAAINPQPATNPQSNAPIVNPFAGGGSKRSEGRPRTEIPQQNLGNTSKPVATAPQPEPKPNRPVLQFGPQPAPTEPARPIVPVTRPDTPKASSQPLPKPAAPAPAPVAQPQPRPQLAPQPVAQPKPQPVAQPKPQPAPTPQPQPRPAPVAQPKPQPAPAPKPSSPPPAPAPAKEKPKFGKPSDFGKKK